MINKFFWLAVEDVVKEKGCAKDAYYVLTDESDGLFCTEQTKPDIQVFVELLKNNKLSDIDINRYCLLDDANPDNYPYIKEAIQKCTNPAILLYIFRYRNIYRDSANRQYSALLDNISKDILEKFGQIFKQLPVSNYIDLKTYLDMLYVKDMGELFGKSVYKIVNWVDKLLNTSTSLTELYETRECAYENYNSSDNYVNDRIGDISNCKQRLNLERKFGYALNCLNTDGHREQFKAMDSLAVCKDTLIAYRALSYTRTKSILKYAKKNGNGFIKAVAKRRMLELDM